MAEHASIPYGKEEMSEEMNQDLMKRGNDDG